MEDKTEYKKRQTAYKIKIKDIAEGKFIKDNDALNAVRTAIGVVSRVNVLGFIISKESSDYFAGAVIDDGTGIISARSFENKSMFDNFEIGDTVNITGRVRLYGEDKYVSVESAKKLDKKWLEHRKKELVLLEKIYGKNENINVENQEKNAGSNNEEFVGSSEIDRIIEIIRSQDSGDGVEIEQVIKKSGTSEGDKIIRELLKNGDVFEIRPGKIKVLE